METYHYHKLSSGAWSWDKKGYVLRFLSGRLVQFFGENSLRDVRPATSNPPTWRRLEGGEIWAGQFRYAPDGTIWYEYLRSDGSRILSAKEADY
jgi:hypothetical protein